MRHKPVVRLTPKQRDWTLALVVAASAVALHAVTIHSPLLGLHSFRQT